MVQPHIQGFPIEIVDRRPADEEDPEWVVSMSLPMANGLTPNMLYHVATIASLLPYRRVVAEGNPGSVGHNGSRMSLEEAFAAVNGRLDLRALPLQVYLEEQGLTKADQIGYSAGVDIAIAKSSTGDVQTKNLIAIEPASVVPRRLWQLAWAFAKSGKYLQEYIDAAQMSTQQDAFDASPGLMATNAGLLRPTNIALAMRMCKGGFIEDLRYALYGAGPELANTTIAWGTASELAGDTQLKKGLDNIDLILRDRIRQIRLRRQHHALANDPLLHGAIVLEGLSPASH
jgi:hypothetical protein